MPDAEVAELIDQIVDRSERVIRLVPIGGVPMAMFEGPGPALWREADAISIYAETLRSKPRDEALRDGRVALAKFTVRVESLERHHRSN
jgi:hypothetical protein